MRTTLLSAFLILAASMVAAKPPQQPPDPDPVYLTSLTDPACPVTGVNDPIPNAKELHVLYFPTASGATISNPKSLTLHLVFDYGFFVNDRQTLPFVRRDDGVWVATVPVKERMPRFAVYWVEDPDNNQSDTKHGKYFDVPFCDVFGRRAETSVKWEAQSYTGNLTAYGIDRPVDFRKAIDIIEENLHPPTQGAYLVGDLWTYKLHLHDDTPEARAALLVEINKFIADHSADGFGLVDALNFVAYETWIPADTTEALLAANDQHNNDPEFASRPFFLQARAALEKDKTKQAALQREIIEKYPDSAAADDVRRTLMFEVKDLAQREELYRGLRKKHPDDAYLPLSMAREYLDAKQKLPEALLLLDEAQKLFEENSSGAKRSVHYQQATLKTEGATIAMTRAKILLELGRPKEALAILIPLKSEFTLGSSYYVLGKALEATGDKKGAADAYLEAAIRPWKDQQQANAALEKIWSQQKLGSKKDLQRRIAEASARSFRDAGYTPRLLQHAAPQFDLTTLRGEHFSNADLKGKMVVLNFWATWCAPCRLELKALQDFQQQHPELVVLTIIDSETDAKELKDVIREKNLTTLRIARSSHELWQQFGAFGVPNTFVIDKTGDVRTHHLGDLPDVSRFLEADLKAILNAVPEKESKDVASR